MKKVITFGVVSKNKPLIDRRHLLAKQKKLNREYAEKNGCMVVSEIYGYTDNGQVYDTDLFENLFKEMNKKCVNTVIISSIDSVLNTNHDYYMVIAEFAWNKDELISVKEGVLTSDSLKVNLHPIHSQYERKADL